MKSHEQTELSLNQHWKLTPATYLISHGNLAKEIQAKRSQFYKSFYWFFWIAIKVTEVWHFQNSDLNAPIAENYIKLTSYKTKW